MAREVVDILLDAGGRVVTDPKRAVELRRTVLVDGEVTERGWFYKRGYNPPEPEAAPKRTGWEKPRGY